MAIATVTGSFSTLHDCEDTTNLISNKTITVDPDTFRENANSAGMTKVSQERAYTYYDYYTAHSNTAWNLSASPTHIFIWGMVANAAGLATIGDAVNGAGIRIYLTDGSGNTGYWHVGGSDTYFGGWECFVVYSGTAFDSNNGTDPTMTDIRHVGFDVYQIAKTTANAMNVWVDYLHYGAGITAYGGTSGDEIGLQEIYDVSENTTNAYGVLKRQAGSWVLQAPIAFGDSAGTNTVYYLDKNEIIIWADRPVSSTHYKFSLAGNATGTTSVIWGAKSGTVGISGCVISDNSGLEFDLNFSATNVDTVAMYGCTLIGYGTITGNTSYETDKELLSCIFNVGGNIDINAMTLKFFTIVGATIYGVQLDSTTFYINNGSLINCAVGLYCNTIGSFGVSDIIFTGNTIDIENPNNATQVDAYSDTNGDTAIQVYSGSITRVAQSFVGTAGNLSRTIFSLEKNASPTGNIVAKLYSDATGPNAILATSNTVDVATLNAGPANFGQVDFEFEDEYTLVVATTYWISVEYTGGDATNRLEVEVDNSTPAHSGTCETYSGTWSSQTYDEIFYVNRDGIVKINATDSNPSTDDNTGAPPGATIIVSSVPLKVKVIDQLGSPIENVQTAVYLTSDDSELMNEDTLTTGFAEDSFGGTTPAACYIRCRKSSVGNTRYINNSAVGTIESNSGLNVTITMRIETLA